MVFFYKSYNSQKNTLPYIYKQGSFIKKVEKWSVKYMGIYEPLKNINQISTYHNGKSKVHHSI